MLKGNIVEEGPSNEIISSPLHPYTKDLLKAAPTLSANVPVLPTNNKNDGQGCPYANRCSKATEVCFKEKPKLKSCRSHCVACRNLKPEKEE